jgi:hypothetical protein
MKVGFHHAVVSPGPLLFSKCNLALFKMGRRILEAKFYSLFWELKEISIVWSKEGEVSGTGRGG